MSLLAPLFLLGILAAIVPWWLHRLSSNNPPQQTFSSSMFLEHTETMSAKQTQLRYRKLLSLRLLFLGLLALLFAEPVINGFKLPGDSARRHLLVIDTSLSQAHKARWQRTREISGDVLNTIPASDEVIVLSAGSTITQSSNSDELTVSNAQDIINTLQPGQTRLDYGRIASSISSVVKDSRLPVDVHLVSDLQHSAMPEQTIDLAIDGIASLQLHTTSSDDDENVSVTAQLDYAADNKADLTAVINNYGNNEVTRTVKVSGGSEELISVTATLAAGVSKVHRFSDIDTSQAAGALEVTLFPEDDLPADDTWVVAVPDGERTEISIISGTTTGIANRYVTAAVESDPRYSRRVIAADNLSASDAGGLIIVPDAATLSDRAASRLQQYISNGGNALMMVGAQPHGSQMRRLLGLATTTARSTGTTSNSPTLTESVAMIDQTHPLATGLSDHWRALSLLRYVSLASNADDRRVIELGSGDPLLVERNIGEGKLLLFTSALDVTWNSLAVEPLFVAFIVRTIEYLSGDSSSAPNHSVGNTITLAPGAQIQSPKGKPLRAIEQLNTRASVVLDAAGVYTIRSATGKTVLSVNSDPRESNITSITNELKNQWLNLTGESPAETVQTTDKKQNTNKGFWRWLLPLLAVIVLIESLFSHRHLLIKRGA